VVSKILPGAARNGKPRPARKLVRETFRTSREMDFFSEKELVTQTGHPVEEWPLVIPKELIDNALDACEEAAVPPIVVVTADPCGISVGDNGPGVPEMTIAGVMDFTVRVSSREAYVAPDRGRQGNALKTLLPMPWLADPVHGRFIITTQGRQHVITCGIDAVSQRPVIHEDRADAPKSKNPRPARNGKARYMHCTEVRLEWARREDGGEVVWPFAGLHPLAEPYYVPSFAERFRELIEGYALFNPHLAITLDWFGKVTTWKATDPTWTKWRPHQPTSALWYERSAPPGRAWKPRWRICGRPGTSRSSSPCTWPTRGSSTPTAARVPWSSRGLTRARTGWGMSLADDILSITAKVTKEWTKQRKAEERGRRSRASRAYVYSDRVDFTAVADRILAAGYAHASGDGRYTVDKRQFYYAVRDEFLEATGREIQAAYFSQNLLVKYMNQHPEKTAHCKITASPRGTLSIPNTADGLLRIPCGTVAIEEHLREAGVRPGPFDDLEEVGVRVQWPSLAERHRYQAVLYIEKEGFDPQLREADIAEKFDVAIVSCKGQSVVAARMYADHVCRVGGGVPLFTAHDMDKSGFEIAQRLTTVSDYARENDLVKYEFKNQINVTDIGLRLTDVRQYELKSERFRFKGYFPLDTIATPEEQAFLRSNRRVELNAFPAPQFIEWITAKLTEHLGRKRFIPADDVLADAWHRAVAAAKINKVIEEARDKAIEEATAAAVPKNLRRQLAKKLKDSPWAWDQALYDLAETKVSQDDED
jgi:hypothetical protein